MRGRSSMWLVLAALAASPLWQGWGVARGEVTACGPGSATAAISVKDFGAIGDGDPAHCAANTAAINKAIAKCSAAGGGRVVIPAGTFVTGPIHLQSDVDLHVDSGAVVLFSRNYADYPLIVTNYEGRDAVECCSPLVGENLHDVSITGQGTFDGQGQVWRPTKHSKVPPQEWNALVKSGGEVDANSDTWYPMQGAADAQRDLLRLRSSDAPPNIADYEKFRPLLRPTLVLLSGIHNLLLDGPTFRNSPNWNIHLLASDNITVHDLTVFNPIYAQNGDGIDVDSCRNVLITDSTINAGDDVICLKSGRDEQGRRRGMPTENVTIYNCQLGWGHGGITIGSEMSGGVRNVNVSNCVMRGTDGGLRFKTTRGRGGLVENINISNIVMSDIREGAITFNMYYMVKAPPTTAPVSDATPQFRQFHISNIECQGARTALELHGLPEMPIQEITLDNIHLSAQRAGEIVDAKDITLRDVHIDAQDGGKVRVENVQNLTAERVDGLPSEAAVSSNYPR